ncbi:NAD-dependent epimerase/dehydratase family protein [Kribbella antibiotica]|uniref:NAD-dependent epimerase/dehydratase family protein n=1 Tax=Kribbella antibiotica TaxID=190195 RepID=UPI00192DA497|nr:NAD-dependent epimerase/dehydratase family protein [Kribbella antibiotica]
MKIVMPGGTGHIGSFLSRYFAGQGHEVVVIGRSSPVRWDGRTLGPWAKELDGADAVINLAGRSVSCRYTPKNLQEMMDSRVDSARVVGEAIAAAGTPPRVWLQMSTATIYAHTFGPANAESGTIGGTEADVPA